jgi:hypothetical protein
VRRQRHGFGSLAAAFTHAVAVSDHLIDSVESINHRNNARIIARHLAQSCGFRTQLLDGRQRSVPRPCSR